MVRVDLAVGQGSPSPKSGATVARRSIRDERRPTPGHSPPSRKRRTRALRGSTFVTNLERRRPGFTQSRRHNVKWLYSEFLLFVINLKIAKRVWPSYRLGGPQWRYDSLFSLIWTQLAEFVVKYPEHTQCKACGKWFLVQGKARGRGKKTCSPSCRVRLSQMKKAAGDGQG